MILKLLSDRWVCAPQYLEASTSMGPKASVSVRVGPAMLTVVDEKSRVVRRYLCAEVGGERRSGAGRVREVQIAAGVGKADDAVRAVTGAATG